MKKIILFLLLLLSCVFCLISFVLTVMAFMDLSKGGKSGLAFFCLFVFGLIADITKLLYTKYSVAEGTAANVETELKATENHIWLSIKKSFVSVLSLIFNLLSIATLLVAIVMFSEARRSDKWGPFVTSCIILVVVVFAAYFLRSKYAVLKNKIQQTNAPQNINFDVPNLNMSDFNLTPYEKGINFEEECAKILMYSGWDVELTKNSRDKGADVIAQKNGHIVAIQCKNQESAVNNKAVQEVRTAKSYYGTHYAVVISKKGSYTSDAVDMAERCHVLLLSEESMLPELEDLVS